LKNLAKEFVVIITAAIFLTACAGMGPGFETPSVNVQSFRAVPSGSGAGLPAFEIGLHVTNPNRQALKLAGVAYSISLNGQKVIDGVGNDLPVIEGYGEGTFSVTAAVNLLAGVNLFRSIASNKNGAFDYVFEAKLDTGALRPKIRVTDSGSISLGQSAN
jgi:LEA14-like dessication related protein